MPKNLYLGKQEEGRARVSRRVNVCRKSKVPVSIWVFVSFHNARLSEGWLDVCVFLGEIDSRGWSWFLTSFLRDLHWLAVLSDTEQNPRSRRVNYCLWHLVHYTCAESRSFSWEMTWRSINHFVVNKCLSITVWFNPYCRQSRFHGYSTRVQVSLKLQYLKLSCKFRREDV